MIAGIGTDIVDLARFAAVVHRRPAVVERCFTPAEAAHCRQRRDPVRHLAARFAAKEAVGKALGIPMTRWQEVEVVRHQGPPRVQLYGRCAQRAEHLGVERVHLSLSHDRVAAIAMAVAERKAL